MVSALTHGTFYLYDEKGEYIGKVSAYGAKMALTVWNWRAERNGAPIAKVALRVAAYSIT